MAKSIYVTDAKELKHLIAKESQKIIEKKIAPDIRKKIATSAKEIKGPASRRRSKDAGKNQETGLGTIGNIKITSPFEERVFNKTGVASTYIQDFTQPQPSVFITDPQNPEKWETDWLVREEAVFPLWVNNGLWMDLEAFLRSGRRIKKKRPARPYIDNAYEKARGDLSTYADWLADGLYQRLGTPRIK